MRKFAIGDIRGDLNLLKRLVDKIGPTDTDSFIFLGSYLGPGPDSKGVIDFLLTFKKQYPNTSFLRGCYEWLFRFCIETEPSWEYQKLWGDMGGFKVFQSYADDKKLMILKPKGNGKAVPTAAEVPLKIPMEHIKFMEEDTYQWYEDDLLPYVCTHSGGHPLLFGGKLDSEEQTVFSTKDWWKMDGLQIPGKTVVFSHHPFREPFRAKGKLGIDLGAGFGGRLCAFDMTNDNVVIASEPLRKVVNG